ncbi:hypothetical protein PoB_000237100 [Plakobranchus ocellatus]|uniref:Uncharacterized protein n=1 Tax=Plakobranchus ocellatus TaxID=259542 RepID=A0AAV3Y0L4_9GAST|nr:hypothetical protein PoB_000237100 [Plakobranchus ocellatus]
MRLRLGARTEIQQPPRPNMEYSRPHYPNMDEYRRLKTQRSIREVLDDVGCDHLPSLITINCCASAQGRDNKPKWNYRKANWGVYRDTLDDALSNVLPDKLTISALNEAFTRAVIHAARRGIPRGVVRKYSPIWSTEFVQAVASVSKRGVSI